MFHLVKKRLEDFIMSEIKTETLTLVLSKMLGTKIICVDFQAKQLHGGTVGDVQLITGNAKTTDGGELPYTIVSKMQRKWERYSDPDSWRREYDFYQSNFGDMYERAAEELGRFQGKLYAEQPAFLQNLTNLSKVEYMKNFYLHYRSWKRVYEYIRSDDCEIPKHICKMLIDIDESEDEIFNRIEKLPIVLCHRDFWVVNIFYSDGKTILMDWDTAGWGYLGEDMASLIADEADIEHMVENYRRCIPAYYKGFSEYVDISRITVTVFMR